MATPIQLKGGLVQTAVVDPDNGFKLTNWWRQYFERQAVKIESNASNIIPAQVFPGLSGALPLTPLPTGSLQAGNYRVTFYARVTTAASVTSSMSPRVTFATGDPPIVATMTGAALTSNDITLPSTWTFLVSINAGTPISIDTLYASNAAGMVYDLSAELEQMGAVSG